MQCLIFNHQKIHTVLPSVSLLSSSPWFESFPRSEKIMDLHHCICLRPTVGWSDLHRSMITATNIYFLVHRNNTKKKKKRKKIAPCAESSFNGFPLCPTAGFTLAVMLDFTSLVLVYLRTASLYLLTTFLQFPFSSDPLPLVITTLDPFA